MDTQERLEELRTELRAERISYVELAELQSLAEYIDPSDVELLEAAGVPESLNCPYCDSDDTYPSDIRPLAGNYRCNGCGEYFTPGEDIED